MVAQPAPFESVHAPRSEQSPDDERAAFVRSLVETMQAALAAEAARVAEDIERRRAAHVAAVHARREPVARRVRELADEDRQAIASWHADERMRIQIERERRIEDLERDLETSLAEHDSRIDQEIQHAEAAIAAHRAEVDAFFASLARETDPVAIARQAGERPRFPTIEINAHAIVSAPPRMAEPTAPAVEEPVVAASPVVPEPTAPATEVAATAEAPLVPVMDPIAAKRAEWWAAWKDLHEPPELSEVLATAEQEASNGDVLEAVTAGAVDRPDHPSTGVLLTSIPILRPFNWLRRDRDSNEGAHQER